MNARQWLHQTQTSLGVFTRDVGTGLLELSHNTLALVGLAVVAAVIFMGGQADLRERVEGLAFGWLKDRQVERAERDGNFLASVSEPGASRRVTVTDPANLNKEQAAVASWLSKRYRVALEPVARLVQEAWSIAPKAQLEPQMILAVVAIESAFNPYAQSPMGAQGLMQVITRVHDDKFEAFGGTMAAFDPVANLRVGVQILRDCAARFGGIDEGLRCYVGATHPDTTDNGYVHKVTSEYRALKQVAAGRPVPVTLVHPAPGAQSGASAQPMAGPAASAAASKTSTDKPAMTQVALVDKP